MDIPRTMEPLLRERAGEMPVVTVYGPRQAGKTTLVRKTFSSYTYANLELPEVRALARVFPVKTATVICRAAPFPIPGGGLFVPFERLRARLSDIAGEP